MLKTPLSLLLSAVALCAQANPGDAQAEREIRAARERSNQAIRKHDVNGFAASLASDFVMVRGSGSFTPSRDEYIKTFAQIFSDPKAVSYRRITDKVEISAVGPLAAEHGHWMGVKADGSEAYAGTYLAMWILTESGWKLRSELYVVLTCRDTAACAEYRKSVPAER